MRKYKRGRKQKVNSRKRKQVKQTKNAKVAEEKSISRQIGGNKSYTEGKERKENTWLRRN